MEFRGVSEDGQWGGRSEDVVRGFCHAVAADVMDRWGALGPGLCRRQRVALVMGVDRGVVAFHDSWGSRKRGIAEAEAMLFVCGDRRVNGIGEDTSSNAWQLHEGAFPGCRFKGEPAPSNLYSPLPLWINKLLLTIIAPYIIIYLSCIEG